MSVSRDDLEHVTAKSRWYSEVIKTNALINSKRRGVGVGQASA